ncbi:MAG: glycosyltransferase family 2 protein [Planctomycetota bacterium]|nr:glycosyltransferase family 2 protein [Planctomycetota bacterium]
MMVEVTVIVPVFNRQSLVVETLDAIAAQTCLPRQVVVVDDGSTDETVPTVARWIAEQESRQGGSRGWRVRLHARSKATAAAARQFGLTQCEATEFVAFLDSDDLWPGDFLERAVGAMARNSEIVAGSTDRRFIDEVGAVCQRDDCRALARNPVRWLFRYGAGVASCTLFRWTAIAAVGGWDSCLETAEDAALFARLAGVGRWIHLPGTAVTFRRFNGRAGEQEGNLSQKYRDRFQRWAATYEGIYEELRGECGRSDRRALRRSIAGYWYRAGKQWMLNRDHAAARVCFDNAVLWCPLMLRPRMRGYRLAAARTSRIDAR